MTKAILAIIAALFCATSALAVEADGFLRVPGELVVMEASGAMAICPVATKPVQDGCQEYVTRKIRPSLAPARFLATYYPRARYVGFSADPSYKGPEHGPVVLYYKVTAAKEK